METLIQIFGQGKDLSVLQMAMRTIVVFIICLFYIRIAGRRSFAMRMPVDNVITILLGAVLSRAIVGASPFVATIVSGAVISVLYRIFTGLAIYSKLFGKMVKGKETLIYKEGRLIRENMRAAMVSEHDVIEEIRINSNLGSYDQIDSIYVERNGEISVVKKEHHPNVNGKWDHTSCL